MASNLVTYVAVFALLLAYVATVAAYAALRTLAALRRDARLLARGTNSPDGRQSLLEATTRNSELTATVAERIEQLQAHVDATETQLRGHVETARQEALAAVAERAGSEAGALRNVAMVRYDAFREMSGRMSFSVAILDDRGDGVTLSAITGRTDTRVYAKAISAGSGEHDLSPEEQQAVTAALGGKRKLKKSA